MRRGDVGTRMTTERAHRSMCDWWSPCDKSSCPWLPMKLAPCDV